MSAPAAAIAPKSTAPKFDVPKLGASKPGAPKLGAPKFAKGKFNQPKAEPKIIFQKFFKSVGPRTYAAQVKELSNGNQLLVLTEGKRDEATDEIRKTRVFVYAEDFREYFRMLQETAAFLREHPLSPEMRQKREKYWAKQKREGAKPPGAKQ